MRISPDIKLDFKDVLIVPQRSSLNSRSKVDLIREYKFPHTNRRISGFGFIAANMDSTGTFAMAKKLAEYKAFTALHKFYEVDEIVKFFLDNKDIWDYVFYSTGITKDDEEKLLKIKDIIRSNENNPQDFPRLLNIDVANGYHEQFTKSVKNYRDNNKNSVIMAGNVVTPNMTEELILNGADIIKIGIGGGCFIAGTKIRTKNGLKSIEKIKIGDEVFTHRGRLKKVINTTNRTENKKLININGTICTGNHEFYAIKDKDKDKVNENNIHEFAKWVPASELNSDYFIIKIEE